MSLSQALSLAGGGAKGQPMSQNALNALIQELQLPVPIYSRDETVPCPHCHTDEGEKTAMQCFSSDALVEVNLARNTKHQQNKAQNQNARRSAAQGTTVIPMLYQCMKVRWHCHGRTDGKGCPLCENGAQKLVPDPRSRNGTLVCSAPCCTGNCSMYHENGKAHMIAAERALAEENAQEKTPHRPSLFKLLAEQFNTAANAQRESTTNNKEGPIDLTKLCEDVGTSLMNEPMSRDEQYAMSQQIEKNTNILKASGKTFNMRQLSGMERARHNRLDHPHQAMSSLGGSEFDEDELARAKKYSLRDAQHEHQIAMATEISFRDSLQRDGEWPMDENLAPETDSFLLDSSYEARDRSTAKSVKRSSTEVINSIFTCETAIAHAIEGKYPGSEEQAKRKKLLRRRVKVPLMAAASTKNDDAFSVVDDAIQNAQSFSSPSDKLEVLVAGVNAMNQTNDNHDILYSDDILSPES